LIPPCAVERYSSNVASLIAMRWVGIEKAKECKCKNGFSFLSTIPVAYGVLMQKEIQLLVEV
jgi:hypothetical protein